MLNATLKPLYWIQKLYFDKTYKMTEQFVSENIQMILNPIVKSYIYL